MWTGVSSKQTAEFITNILSGCANAQLKWGHLDSEIQIILQNRLLVGASSFNGRQLSNNLHSLQKMGVKWSDLFVDLQNEFLRSLSKLRNTLDPQQRSICIYSLGSLGVVFGNCDVETQTVIGEISMRVFNSKISEHVKHSSFFAQDQSNTFIGLTLMGLKYSAMDAALIQAIDHSLQYNLGFGDPQQVPNTIHS
jgi:hypothetical protein